MPRIDHTAQVMPAAGYAGTGIAANAADLTFVAADATNKEKVTHSSSLIIIAWNSGATPRTVTISSVALNGRTGDIGPYTLEAGDHAVFGPFPAAGWKQTDSKLYLEASHADVKFAYLLQA